MKRFTIPALALAGVLVVGCQEEPAEPQASNAPAPSYEQPTTPPPAFDTTGTQHQDHDHVEPIDQIERISMDEYIALRDADEVVTIDVRSSQYYVEGHIPGSINIPAGQITAMVDMIPKGKKIVTYCT